MQASTLDYSQLQKHLDSFMDSHGSAEDKVKSYYNDLSNSNHLYTNLADLAFRNTTKGKIIKHYLTQFFLQVGVAFDEDLQQKLTLRIATADVQERVKHKAMDIDLHTIKKLHFDAFRVYAPSLDEAEWNQSNFMMPFGDMLWLCDGLLLDDIFAARYQYISDDKFELDRTPYEKLGEYMQFMEAAFYTDALLKQAIWNLPQKEKHNFFEQIKSDIQYNLYLQNEWQQLIAKYGEPDMLQEILGDCVYMDNTNNLHCDMLNNLLHSNNGNTNQWVMGKTQISNKGSSPAFFNPVPSLMPSSTTTLSNEYLRLAR